MLSISPVSISFQSERIPLDSEMFKLVSHQRSAVLE